jgi:diguanylate cyclase (GGDEF)-like protein
MSAARENTNTNSTTAPHPRPEVRRPYLMVIAGSQIGELHKLARTRTNIGRSPDTDLRLDEPGVSREHVEILVEGGRVTVRDLGSTNGTLCNGERFEKREVGDGDKLSIGTSTFLVFTHNDGIELPYQRGRAHAALHDGATEALRRQLFLDRLSQEISFSRRHGAPLALLLWEIDGYAALEDRLGPSATRVLLGDAVRDVRPTLNEDDVLAAFGPGRFAVACPETSLEDARTRAEHLRAALADAELEPAGADVRLTASVAVVPSAAGTERVPVAAAALVRAAEAALARAIAAGGNRVDG